MREDGEKDKGMNGEGERKRNENKPGQPHTERVEWGWGVWEKRINTTHRT